MLTSSAGGVMSTALNGDWAERRVLVVGSCGDLDIALTDALATRSAKVFAEQTMPAGASSLDCRDAAGEPQVDRYQQVLALTQCAVKSLGGLDGVVTLVELDSEAIERAAAGDGVEQFCSDTLAGPLAAVRVALNRMGTTWVEGALAAVLVIPPALSPRAQLVARIARSMLVDIVRHEAVRAAPFGISVRAVILDQSLSDDAEAAVSAILASISLSAASLSGIAVEVEG